MFKVVDVYDIIYTVYSVLEKNGNLYFLIYSGNWKWVEANQFYPLKQHMQSKYSCTDCQK